ncbi:MAG: hypothetical protein MJE77_07940 [Proteobacteria bacterium]|nr:hypothetical protein [Pseudomonadota bacterium]
MPSAQQVHWTEKLQTFDRRWIFLAMGLAIVIPLLLPLELPIKVSPMVRSIYNVVEQLDDDDVVFLSVDLDPASTPELEPFYRAVVLHLKRKNIKLVLATTWYQAPPLVEKWIRQSLDQALIPPGGVPGYDGPPDRPYKNNVDYVWLGFREGKLAVMQAMGKDLHNTFDGRAADGTALDQIAMMQGIKRISDFDLMVMVSAGFPGIKEWVQQVQTRYGVRMVGSCTAVSTTDLTPYYDAGQLLGLAGGMAASAEYEKLVGRPAQATEGADVLNIGHLVIILAIIFGNIIYFIDRSRRRRGLA